MLRKLRIISATIFFLLITIMFCDFTGLFHKWFSWIAKIQLVPAILAVNIVIVVILLLLTLLFGRIYCSVICPLGVMQDLFSWIGGKIKRNRFSFKRDNRRLRYGIFILFVILFAFGFNYIAILIEPYSIYGRIASNLFSPVYQSINNIFAYFAERMDSYAFYSVDIIIKSALTFALSIGMFILLGVLAVKKGRWWCNNICPVGTFLGVVSLYSIFKPTFNKDKCTKCGLCSRNCKSSCIDYKSFKIDYSRCVTCMDCISECPHGAMTYSLIGKKQRAASNNEIDTSKRNFLALTTTIAATATISSYAKEIDGGLAAIEKKKSPERAVSIKPAGSISFKNFSNKCTACQLCVTACPSGVLRPSTKLTTLMQPEISYENGYCQLGCTRCADACPTGAISSISKEEKSSTQIGHAVWIKDNCVVLRDGVTCGNCARHCPTGAITMVEAQGYPAGTKIPAVNTAVCIGCGACENLCPARPFSAIYVEGHEVHKLI